MVHNGGQGVETSQTGFVVCTLAAVLMERNCLESVDVHYLTAKSHECLIFRLNLLLDGLLQNIHLKLKRCQRNLEYSDKAIITRKVRVTQPYFFAAVHEYPIVSLSLSNFKNTLSALTFCLRRPAPKTIQHYHRYRSLLPKK